MKKTMELTHPKIKYDRMIERVKHDIRKYLKRERRRELPEDADFWDFNCKFGDTEAQAKVVHLAEMNACIDAAAERKLQSFYVEIIAKPARRNNKSKGGE